jgi:nucleoside-diphosphate-sugar epimerase
VDLLIGDASKAARELGWTAKVGIEELVAIMMENDLQGSIPSRLLWKNQLRYYVAGHRGMVGSAIVRQLELAGFSNIMVRTHHELDLCNQAGSRRILCTGKTGLCIPWQLRRSAASSPTTAVAPSSSTKT